MGIIERLREATRTFVVGAKAFQVSTLVGNYANPQYMENNYEALAKNGLKKNELIFACIEKTANTASQVVLEVHDKRNDEEIDNHPLAALLERPNPLMSGFDFWVSVLVYLKLAGEAYFEKERNGIGLPVRLWPLRPDWIKPIPGGPDALAGYMYAPPGVEAQVIPAEDVMHFKLYDPLNIYRGLSPTLVASRVGQVDNDATDFIKLFFQEGGVPLGILSSKMQLQDAQVENIRRRWRERYGGWANWLEPAVLDSDSTYQRIGMTFQEMGFEVLDSRDEARICMVMDVPPIIVGAKVGIDRATYSNYEQARKAWWEDTLFALYTQLAAELNTSLAPEFGNNIRVVWDFSKVPALTENESDKWKRALQALNSGGITVNEFREYVGLESAPGRDVFLQPINVTEVVWGQKSVVQSQQELALQRAANPEPDPADSAENAPGGSGDGQVNESDGTGRGNATAPKSRSRKQLPPGSSHERELAALVDELFVGERRDLTGAVEKYRNA